MPSDTAARKSLGKVANSLLTAGASPTVHGNGEYGQSD
ncbi:hypothetical protein JCM19235_2404 [Vibrio maritimus]|uniref:Uncharacterized protein n=1 Tax=Vibrio maritimus TaxID=990268 RepID=A0A090RUR4_9VIBR|nr:hypothetical protein JCM19235_2404 [Vibrio maritimus]